MCECVQSNVTGFRPCWKIEYGDELLARMSVDAACALAIVSEPHVMELHRMSETQKRSVRISFESKA